MSLPLYCIGEVKSEDFSVLECNTCSKKGTLAIDGSVVIWYTRGSVQPIRRFVCESRPLDASLCQFRNSNIHHGVHCIAILLTQRHLRLYLTTGETYDLPLPFLAQQIFPSRHGLFVQRQRCDAGKSARNSHFHCKTARHTIYHVAQPLSPMTPVRVVLPLRHLYGSVGETIGDANDSEFVRNPTESSQNVTLLAARDDVVCGLHVSTGRLMLFRVEKRTPVKLEPDLSIISTSMMNLSHDVTTNSAISLQKSTLMDSGRENREGLSTSMQSMQSMATESTQSNISQQSASSASSAASMPQFMSTRMATRTSSRLRDRPQGSTPAMTGADGVLPRRLSKFSFQQTHTHSQTGKRSGSQQSQSHGGGSHGGGVGAMGALGASFAGKPADQIEKLRHYSNAAAGAEINLNRDSHLGLSGMHFGGEYDRDSFAQYDSEGGTAGAAGGASDDVDEDTGERQLKRRDSRKSPPFLHIIPAALQSTAIGTAICSSGPTAPTQTDDLQALAADAEAHILESQLKAGDEHTLMPPPLQPQPQSTRRRTSFSTHVDVSTVSAAEADTSGVSLGQQHAFDNSTMNTSQDTEQTGISGISTLMGIQSSDHTCTDEDQVQLVHIASMSDLVAQWDPHLSSDSHQKITVHIVREDADPFVRHGNTHQKRRAKAYTVHVLAHLTGAYLQYQLLYHASLPRSDASDTSAVGGSQGPAHDVNVSSYSVDCGNLGTVSRKSIVHQTNIDRTKHTPVSMHHEKSRIEKGKSPVGCSIEPSADLKWSVQLVKSSLLSSLGRSAECADAECIGRVLSMAHVTVPLGSIDAGVFGNRLKLSLLLTEKSAYAQCIPKMGNGKAACGDDGARTSTVDVGTPSNASDHHISVLLGQQLFGVLPLEWEDDLGMLKGTLSDAVNGSVSIATLHGGSSAEFALQYRQRSNEQHAGRAHNLVLSLPPLLFPGQTGGEVVSLICSTVAAVSKRHTGSSGAGSASVLTDTDCKTGEVHASKMVDSAICLLMQLTSYLNTCGAALALVMASFDLSLSEHGSTELLRGFARGSGVTAADALRRIDTRIGQFANDSKHLDMGRHLYEAMHAFCEEHRIAGSGAKTVCADVTAMASALNRLSVLLPFEKRSPFSTAGPRIRDSVSWFVKQINLLDFACGGGDASVQPFIEIQRHICKSSQSSWSHSMAGSSSSPSLDFERVDVEGPLSTLRLLYALFHNFERIVRRRAESEKGIFQSTDLAEAFIASVGNWHLPAYRNGGASRASDRGLSLVEDALSLLPETLRLSIQLSLKLCRMHPPAGWPQAILMYIGREDLVANSALLEGPTQGKLSDGRIGDREQEAHGSRNDGDLEREGAGGEGASVESDGLCEVIRTSRLRFADDDRIDEACRLLRSSRSLYLRVEKAPDATDLDHREKQQLRLLTLCRRSLACSVGRGLLTMDSLVPRLSESGTSPVPVPPLSLVGRVPPTNSVIALDSVYVPAELTLWPEFHNGVAAGLRVGSMLPARARLRAGLTDASASLSSGNGNVGGQATEEVDTDSEDDAHSTWPSASAANGSAQRPAVTRNWIMYNRSAAMAAGADNSHAGVLLGLGLQGHLGVLSVTDICDYLTQGHEPTTVAVLIGTAASRIGSADPLISKTLCLHLPSLLPPIHTELEISSVVQASAITGLGLLYCSTGHRLMTEFLLAELSRKPSPDHCDNREALALSTAWALGMVLLAKGSAKAKERVIAGTDAGISATSISNSSNTNIQVGGDETGVKMGLEGLTDLHIEDRLQLLIDGGPRPSNAGLFFSSSSSQAAPDQHSKNSRVLETDFLNIDVTAPGAILALALIYFGSGSAEIARRLALPQTPLRIDAMRPDLLLYRALGQCLILGEGAGGVDSTEAWLDAQIPTVIALSVLPKDNATKSKLDRMQSQLADSAESSKATAASPALLDAYLCAVAGFSLGMGIVYAGTARDSVKACLLSKLKMLQRLRDNRSNLRGGQGAWLDKGRRPTIEMCLCCCALALSTVMAGTGCLESMRVLRELRYRVDDVAFGSHLALGTAVGMLFLAGGAASVCRDAVSAACLVLAFIPRYPHRTIDNQFHLQPLRHLSALAVEKRLLRTIDIDSGTTVSVYVLLELSDGSTKRDVTPCLLPELAVVNSIHVTGVVPSSSSSSSSSSRKKGNDSFGDDESRERRLETMEVFSGDVHDEAQQYHAVEVHVRRSTIPSENGSKFGVGSQAHKLPAAQVPLRPVYLKAVQRVASGTVSSDNRSQGLRESITMPCRPSLTDLLAERNKGAQRKDDLVADALRNGDHMDDSEVHFAALMQKLRYSAMPTTHLPSHCTRAGHTEGGRSTTSMSAGTFESADIAMNESLAKFTPVMKICFDTML